MATHQLPPRDSFVDTSRYERIEARLVERPLPSEQHAQVQYAVTTLLRAQAKALHCDALQEWTIDENEQLGHDWMTPDVLVAAKSRPQGVSGNLLPPAILAVEILSPSQTIGEMRLKALRYFGWGVAHVWIIDPELKSAVTLSASHPGHGEIVFDGRIEGGGFSLELATIFDFE